MQTQGGRHRSTAEGRRATHARPSEHRGGSTCYASSPVGPFSRPYRPCDEQLWRIRRFFFATSVPQTEAFRIADPTAAVVIARGGLPGAVCRLRPIGGSDDQEFTGKRSVPRGRTLGSQHGVRPDGTYKNRPSELESGLSAPSGSIRDVSFLFGCFSFTGGVSYRNESSIPADGEENGISSSVTLSDGLIYRT
jgi:hypothetical protein